MQNIFLIWFTNLCDLVTNGELGVLSEWVVSSPPVCRLSLLEYSYPSIRMCRTDIETVIPDLLLLNFEKSSVLLWNRTIIAITEE